MERAEQNGGACSNCIVNFFIESECQPDDSSIAVDDGTSRFTMYKSAENFNGIRSRQKNVGARRVKCAEYSFIHQQRERDKRNKSQR